MPFVWIICSVDPIKPHELISVLPYHLLAFYWLLSHKLFENGDLRIAGELCVGYCLLVSTACEELVSWIVEASVGGEDVDNDGID